MNDDEEIRKLVDDWMLASKEGDIDKVLSLMTDDVIFMTPGNEPFGKEAFRKASEEMKDMKIDGKSNIKEIKVLGDWAYIRNFIEIKMSSPENETVNRKGYTLTILKKENGKWKLFRDANLVS